MPDPACAPVDVPLQAGVSMAEPHLCAPIDANGNLTADGTRTFEWDARNQLVAVTVGPHRSEFVYDGLQRRVRQVEKENGVVQSDTRVLWCETAICEERAADGVTVTRRAFGLGEHVNGQARFFTTDHLGSVREVTDTAGTLLARYAFDPWGRRTVTAGADVTTVGFTGHRTHTSSGLALALYRGYDAGLGRWVSEDPIGLGGGDANLSAYVWNRSTRYLDLLGLEVVNRGNTPVVVKPESGPIGTVPGGQTYPGRIDGVIGADGKWTKFSGKWWLPDNRAEVTKEGEVKCIGGLCRVLPPQKLDHPPDETWNPPKDPKELPGCKPNK